MEVLQHRLRAIERLLNARTCPMTLMTFGAATSPSPPRIPNWPPKRCSKVAVKSLQARQLCSWLRSASTGGRRLAFASRKITIVGRRRLATLCRISLRQMFPRTLMMIFQLFPSTTFHPRDIGISETLRSVAGRHVK